MRSGALLTAVRACVARAAICATLHGYAQNCSNLFSTGGGERLAEECAVPFLGRIPIDPALGEALEKGTRGEQQAPCCVRAR